MNPILARFAGEPSLVAPERRDRFEACLDAVLSTEHGPAMLREGAAAGDGFWPEPGSWKAAYRPYVVVAGVLQIPIKGVLLHDFSFTIGGFATGYVYIRRAFERGMADPNVKGIALICDSPGGEVAGCFDLVDAMHAGKTGKPVWAFAHEAAYSAAYAVASVADKIWVSRTGGVGSIGVVTAHTDVSKALDARGVKVTFIFAGKHKIDGNPYEPLPAEVAKRIQARIDGLMSVFVSTVARNRKLKPSAVRATEALCFSADEAVQNKLADAIGSLDDAVAAFAADLSAGTPQDEQLRGGRTAAGRPTQIPGRNGTGSSSTRTNMDEDEKAIRANERERIRAIVGSPEAEGRQAQALAVALQTSLPPEEACAILKASPKVENAGPSNAAKLAERMAAQQPLALDPENPAGKKKKASRINAGEIYAARRNAAAKANAEAETGGRR